MILTGSVPSVSTFGFITRTRYSTTPGQVAGGPRGDGSVDFQPYRINSTQIASGAYSFLGAGANNTASNESAAVIAGFGSTAAGKESFIGAGKGNQTTNTWGGVVAGNQNSAGFGAFIGAGEQNSVASTAYFSTVVAGKLNSNSASNSFIGSGIENTISSGGTQYSAILCGMNNTVSSSIATVLHGQRALIASGRDRYTAMAHAGSFSAAGDCQMMSLMLRGVSTNATPVFITSNGLAGAASNLLNVPVGKLITGIIWLQGIASTIGGNVWSIVRKFGIRNDNGATSLVGPVSAVGTDSTAPPTGWAVSITANDGVDALVISCTGSASETVRWTAYIEWIETALGT
jgi:hypothetical protein